MKVSKRLATEEFCRYVVVGGVAFLCDFSAYVGLTEIAGWNYLVANIVGFSLGLFINYLLSIIWVFNHRAISSVKREFTIFAGIGVLNLSLGELLLWLMVAGAGLQHVVAKVIMTALVFLSNFCMRKVMLFHART